LDKKYCHVFQITSYLRQICDSPLLLFKNVIIKPKHKNKALEKMEEEKVEQNYPVDDPNNDGILN